MMTAERAKGFMRGEGDDVKTSAGRLLRDKRLLETTGMISGLLLPSRHVGNKAEQASLSR